MDDLEKPRNGPVFPYKRLLLVSVPAFGALLWWVVSHKKPEVVDPKAPIVVVPAAAVDTNMVTLKAAGPAGAIASQNPTPIHSKQGDDLIFSVAQENIAAQGDANAENWQLFVAENSQPPVPINPTDPLTWTYVAGTEVQEAKVCALHLPPDDNEKVLKVIENFNAKNGPHCINVLIDGPAQLEPQSSLPEDANATPGGAAPGP